MLEENNLQNVVQGRLLYWISKNFIKFFLY